MNKNQEKENVAKVVDAIQNYATAYKALNTLQIGDKKAFPIPIGDQKTGCIGEFYSYLYLASILEQGQQIDFGKHSQNVWDLKVVKDRDETTEKEKGNFEERTVYHWIQVKTVSAYAKFRTLSPIHLKRELIENRDNFGTRFSLYVLHLNERLRPDGFWIFEKDTLYQIARDKGINIEKDFSLKGIHCPNPDPDPDPDHQKPESKDFEWDKYDKTGELLKVLSRY